MSVEPLAFVDRAFDASVQDVKMGILDLANRRSLSPDLSGVLAMAMADTLALIAARQDLNAGHSRGSLQDRLDEFVRRFESSYVRALDTLGRTRQSP